LAVRKTSKGSALLLSERPIYRKIVIFAFPLFLSNLFQQLYNAADSLIVGNLIGSDALASVSSSGNLIFLLVGFLAVLPWVRVSLLLMPSIDVVNWA